MELHPGAMRWAIKVSVEMCSLSSTCLNISGGASCTNRQSTDERDLVTTRTTEGGAQLSLELRVVSRAMVCVARVRDVAEVIWRC